MNGTVSAIFTLAVLAAGYIAVFALWWFVFRKGGE